MPHLIETDQSQHSTLLCTEECERKDNFKQNKKTKRKKIKSLESPVNDHFTYSFNYDIVMNSPEKKKKKELAHFLYRLSKNRKKEKPWPNLYIEGRLCILEKELLHHCLYASE